MSTVASTEVWVLRLLEIPLLVVAFFVIFLSWRIFGRQRLFHSNLILVLHAGLVAITVVYVLRLGLVLIRIAGMEPAGEGWWLQYHSALSQAAISFCFGGVTSMNIERIFALTHLNRYEREKHTIVGLAAIALNLAISLFIGFNRLFPTLHTYWLSFGWLTWNGCIGVVCYMIIYGTSVHYNSAFVGNRVRPLGSYSLSERLQVQENLRLFKLFVILSPITLVFAVVYLGSLFYVEFFNLELKSLILECRESLVSGMVVLWTVNALLVSPAWRHYGLVELRSLGLCAEKPSSTQVSVYNRTVPIVVTENHFERLKQMWA